MTEPAHDDRPDRRLDLPELLTRPTGRPRWQFGLWYLLLMMTVVAAIAGVARYMSDMPPLAIGMGVYAIGIAVYMLIRIPWVVALMSPEYDRLRENRRRLAEWADQKRGGERNCGDGKGV